MSISKHIIELLYNHSCVIVPGFGAFLTKSIAASQSNDVFFPRKKLVTFNLLGPVGDIVEEWTLKGAFIQSANFGDMDYGTSDPVEIALTLQYDYAILQF